MADFKVDSEAFSIAIKRYEEELEKLNSIKIALKKSFEQLKNEGWNSKAGEAYIKRFDENWSTNIDKYTKLVRELTMVLSKADSEFSTLIDEARKLEY